MKYEKLAKDIIENVGGKENVNSVVHCITRLRFKLKDESKANTDVLNNMDGVVTVMKSGGQYQVVIGNHVPDVYKAVVAEGGFDSAQPVEAEEEGEKGSLFNRFIAMISGIFQPILAVLVAAGMVKGFNALFVAVGWLDNTSGTYQILNAIGDGLFYFLPIFLGYTAMKKFGGTPFLGMLIATALVYPALDPSAFTGGEPLYTLFAGTVFESPVYIEFLGIPVILMTYSMSVIPIIISTFFAARLEKFFTKVLPDVVKTFLVPMLTILIIVPLTFIVIGPIATWAAQLLGEASLWMYDLSPIIAGIIIGAFWLVFVMFGLHWGLVPLAINNFATLGYDPILALMFTHSWALAGALLAVWIKTRNQKTKSLSAPAFISAIFGVTEPGMYGIALPLKKPFIFTLVVSGIGGAILGLLGTTGYVMGGLGLFQFPTFIHPENGMDLAFWGSVIAAVLGLVLTFIVTYLFGGINKNNTPATEGAAQTTTNTNVQATTNVNTTVKSEAVVSPLNGEVKPLAEIKDTAFASGALGQGVAIITSEGKLYAPVSGTVTALFPTNHAIGVTSEDGAEVLMHIGMDTVQLDGKHFKAHVEQGARVEKGQLLIEFDVAAIKDAGYDLTTPVVVTNQDKYEITATNEKTVKSQDNLLELKAK